MVKSIDVNPKTKALLISFELSINGKALGNFDIRYI